MVQEIMQEVQEIFVVVQEISSSVQEITCEVQNISQMIQEIRHNGLPPKKQKKTGKHLSALRIPHSKLISNQNDLRSSLSPMLQRSHVRISLCCLPVRILLHKHEGLS